MGIADTSIAAVAAIFSGGAAVAAWQASKHANRTADSVAQIERDRFHRELTPRLSFRIKSQDNGTFLHVRLNGPTALGRLDAIDISIRDDRDHTSDPVLGDGRDVEERDRTIWGPFRFRPGVDGADNLGRTLGTFTMEMHDSRPFVLDPSAAPSWFEGAQGAQDWQKQYRDLPLRLWAICTAEGHKLWRLSAEVHQRRSGGLWTDVGP
ncbi:hypothetical protein [Streptomyces xantholiticus]|uniref:Secreted protein n=1 Tax=Streptomyces xantholiticus TaxID=68285 RepID=A0ABV1V031_9ACTN